MHTLPLPKIGLVWVVDKMQQAVRVALFAVNDNFVITVSYRVERDPFRRYRFKALKVSVPCMRDND